MPVAHIATKEHGDVPGWAASGDNVVVLGLRIIGHTLQWVWYCGELAPFLTGDGTLVKWALHLG